MTDDELVKEYDWFNQNDEDGLATLAALSITPYGALNKTLVEREISRRAGK